MKRELLVILGVIGILVVIFFVGDRLGLVGKAITGFQTANAKSYPQCPLGQDSRPSIIGIPNIYEIQQCVDEDDEGIGDNPKSGCQEEIPEHTCIQAGGGDCCWSVCGQSTFMYQELNFGFFSQSNEDKESQNRDEIEAASITFNRNYPCKYSTHSFTNGELCNDPNGCFTCAGGYTRQSMYVITRLGRALRLDGGFVLSGGTEKYTNYVDDNGQDYIGLAHSEGSNHYTGEAFDTTSKQRIDTFLEQKQYSDDKEFFDNYGFTKDSIVCNWDDLPERPGKPSRDHYHCVIDQAEVNRILKCEVNRHKPS